MPSDHTQLADDLVRAVERLADVSVVRDEWAPFAATEVARTTWFEDAAARLVPAHG